MQHPFLALTLTGLMLVLTLSGCAPAPAESLARPTARPGPTAEAQNQPATDSPAMDASPGPTPAGDSLSGAVARKLAGMTLEQKVGQLFFVRPDALDPNQTRDQINDADAEGVTALTGEMTAMLADYPVGGVVLFGKNITDPHQLQDFVAALHGSLDPSPLVAIDEEGGAVARLANHPGFALPRYPSAAAVGEEGSDAVNRMSATIGGYLADYQIDLDFAPVADVNTNPNNPIIGSRAFSRQPEQAAELVSAAVQGFAQTGVLCCLKHYPGHGDTAEDSHKSLAVTHKSWEQLTACELLPFQAGIRAGAELVMVGHIAAPAVTGTDTPASLSAELVGSLRSQLGFSGAIVTDSLAMEGITQQYSPGQAAVQAIQAGVDILLMPDGLAEAYDAVMAAVRDGTIPESRIEQSAARVLALKETRGLI